MMGTTPLDTEQYKDVIMCGFLVKSPPSVENNSKRNSLFQSLNCGVSLGVLFKKRWRERYCVLYKIRYREKTEIFFEYYKDSQCSKLKGRVDLEHCDCIVDDDKVGRWANVFSLQTIHNNQKRFYHFSAPNHQTMSQWVRHLVNVTGFVDSSQTLDHNAVITSPPHITSYATFGSRRGIPSLRSPVTVDSTLSPGVISNRWPVNSNMGPGMDVPQLWQEDGYGDISNMGADYVMTCPQDDPDGYNKLPAVAHSYVNLSSATDKTDSLSPVNGHPHVPSCPHLPLAPDKKVQAPSLPPRPDKPVRSNKAPTELATHWVSAQQDPNELYFNVWEASDGAVTNLDGKSANHSTAYALPTRIPRDSRAETLPPLTDFPRSNVRIYRRSQFLGDSGHPNGHFLEYTNIPTAPSNRKPAPPPPARHVPSTQSSSNTLPPLTLQDPLVQSSLNRIPSTSSDCALPVRASVENIADSTMDSDSSESTSSLEHLPIEEPRVSDDGTKEPLVDDAAAIPKSVISPVQSSHPAPKQLNYIEPHNLEIGSSISNGGHGVAPAVPPPLPQKLASNCSTLPKDSIPEEPSSSDDYKTEYREIDPIGTNALAIVTKRYLDDDDDDETSNELLNFKVVKSI